MLYDVVSVDVLKKIETIDGFRLGLLFSHYRPRAIL